MIFTYNELKDCEQIKISSKPALENCNGVITTRNQTFTETFMRYGNKYYYSPNFIEELVYIIPNDLAKTVLT